MEVKIEGKKIFAPIQNKWVKLTEEERLKQEFISRLVNYYGYDINQLGEDVLIKKKVRVDIAIWKNKNEKEKKKKPAIIIAVDCRAEHISIRKEEFKLSYNVAYGVEAAFFIATNLKETKIYHIRNEAEHRDFEPLNDIPHADKIQSEKTLREYVEETTRFTRVEFSKLLFKCHNIIRNNDKLSPEAAFDEISKILFMKIRYERTPGEYNVFTLAAFRQQQGNYEQNIRPVNIKLHGPKADIPYMDYWFELTKAEFASDEIFDEHEKVRIKQGSFEAIVKELEKYNLSDTSDDVKGIAFEEFLGRTFRGELGQFFTPRTVVDYMVAVLDPQEGETVCDPCCGSGGFLIKAFEYVRNKIEGEIQKAKEELKARYFTDDYDRLPEDKQDEIEATINDLFSKLNTELDLQNPYSRIRALSYDYIFGTDANPRMARTAKMNMIMHGDGHTGVHHHDGLLNVNGIYEGRFDVILTNPPFGARVEKSLRVTEQDLPTREKIDRYEARYPGYEQEALAQIRNGLNKPVLNLFAVGEMSGLTEVLFIERSLRLLKPGGRMAIVLPEGVLNNPILQRVREWVEGKAKLINITSIPQDVFLKSGATVKPSLVFLKKFTEEETERYNSIKWQATQAANEKYNPPLHDLAVAHERESKALKAAKDKDGFKVAKKRYEEAVRALTTERDEEIKATVKKNFNYSIPIVEVEKAGISSTGAVIENELVTVAEEFERYRRSVALWQQKIEAITYPVDAQGNILRLGFAGAKEPQVFYKTSNPKLAR